MKKLFLPFLLLSYFYSHLFSQGYYLVFFRDKDTTMDLTLYYDAKAIERRALQGISFDWYDYPVKKEYIRQTTVLADTFFYAYRWLNAVWVYVSDISRIEHLPFVTKIEKLNTDMPNVWRMASCHQTPVFTDRKMEILYSQINSMQGRLFHQNGFAVLDAGFTKANQSIFLKHLFDKGKILRAYDFIKKDTIKYKHSTHGRMTLSCIAGKKGDTLIGLANDAEFLLARTEYNFLEVFKEELLWMKAVEWADRYGADIISSSLGYEKPRYCRDDMDGHSVYVTRAALIAARKGILVINAAGNSGDNDWRMLGAPADADSILTVGGTMCCIPLHISFSGVGPTYDGRMKPEVVANANVMADGVTVLSHVYGTSFSTPLVAGFAACVWSKQRTWNNMELRKKIMESGSLYPYFDYAHGYGIPQASYFFGREKIAEPMDSINVRGDDNFIYISVDNHTATEKVMYYKVCDSNNKIINYGAGISKPHKITTLYLKRDIVTDKKLVVFFRGNIRTYYF